MKRVKPMASNAMDAFLNIRPRPTTHHSAPIEISDDDDDDSLVSSPVDHISTQTSIDQSPPPPEAVQSNSCDSYFSPMKRKSYMVTLKLPPRVHASQPSSYIVKLKLPTKVQTTSMDSDDIQIVSTKPAQLFFQRKSSKPLPTAPKPKATTTTLDASSIARPVVKGNQTLAKKKPNTARPILDQRSGSVPVSTLTTASKDNNVPNASQPSTSEPPKYSRIKPRDPVPTPDVTLPPVPPPSIPEKNFFNEKPVHAPFQVLHIRSGRFRRRYDLVHPLPFGSTSSIYNHNSRNHYEQWNYTIAQSTNQKDIDSVAETKTLDRQSLRRLIHENVDDVHRQRTLKYLVERLFASYSPVISDELWCDKYRPPKPSSLVTSDKCGLKISRWIADKISHLRTVKKSQFNLAKASKRKRKTQSADDDFIVDDYSEDEREYSCEFLILEGSPGCCKSASVYAAAQKLDAFVFEINSSQKRTGKDLVRLLDGLGESHVVHHRDGSTSSKQDIIVLLDDVDTLDEEESSSFWPALEKVAKSCRRPIVLTCCDSTAIPLFIFEQFENFVLHMDIPSLPLHTDLLWLIALNEGYILDKELLRELAISRNHDLRASIAQLQFFCSANDIPRTNDSSVHPIEIDADNTTYHIEIDADDSAEPIEITDDEPISRQFHVERYKPKIPGRELPVTSVCEALDVAQAQSDFEIMESRCYSSFEPDPALEFERHAPLPFELAIWKYKPTSETGIDLSQCDPVELHQIDAIACDFTLDSLPRTQFVTEVLPYMRSIALTDQALLTKKNEISAAMNIKRTSRRSLAMTGLKLNTHFDELVDLPAIIATYPSIS